LAGKKDHYLYVAEKKRCEMKVPKIGLLVCNSGASNSGLISGKASIEAVEELGEDWVGICSLPALANEIPRQVKLVRNLRHRIIIDGCHNACARNIARKLAIPFDAYINLEDDLKMEKMGPFSTLRYSDDDVKRAKEAIKARVGQLTDE